MKRAPRTEWRWTAPPPDGKRVQVWVDVDGHPLEIDVDVSDLSPLPDVLPAATNRRVPVLPPDLDFDFRPIDVSRVATPTLDETALAALLIPCLSG